MFVHMSYEALIAALRKVELDAEMRTRIAAELRSRDRAAHNQWVQANGGEFK